MVHIFQQRVSIEKALTVGVVLSDEVINSNLLEFPSGVVLSFRCLGPWSNVAVEFASTSGQHNCAKAASNTLPSLWEMGAPFNTFLESPGVSSSNRTSIRSAVFAPQLA